MVINSLPNFQRLIKYAEAVAIFPLKQLMSQGSIKCVLTCAPGRGFIASGGNLKLLLVLQKKVGKPKCSKHILEGWLVGWLVLNVVIPQFSPPREGKKLLRASIWK